MISLHSFETFNVRSFPLRDLAILANTRTRNMVKNVESNTKHYFPSDHFPLEVRLKIKLSKHKGRPPDKSNEWKSPPKPSTNAQEQCNATVAQTYQAWAPDKESENKEELGCKINALNYALEQVAELHLEKDPKMKKKTQAIR